MREIINFFIRNSKWFVFTAYVVVSIILLVKNNPVHRSLYLSSANSISSTVYDWTDNVTNFFNLRENNNDLNRRNAELQAEVASLRMMLDDLQAKAQLDSADMPETLRPYSFVVAHVIKNSVIKPYNYLTINKGREDGVREEMGVIDQNGVVGVVDITGPHSARVISLLNPDFRLSCKIKDNESFGSLYWDGKDPRYAVLEELPRHTVFELGDTVVTSGYSAVFPPGIPVGIISQKPKGVDNAETLRIKLLTDFSTLNNVQVVVNYMADELRELENAGNEPGNDKHK